MPRTRVFKSGNSQAVRIPAEIAYEDPSIELEITRLDDVIMIAPVRKSMKEIVAELRRMPKLPHEELERIELPEREWD